MLQSVEINKKNSSLNQMAFASRCSFCKHLSVKIVDNYCNLCKKYLSYVKENDAVIVSFANLFGLFSIHKNSTQMSWFDFLQVEKIITKVANHEIRWKYFHERLAIFIDLDQVSNDEIENMAVQIHKICSNISNLGNLHISFPSSFQKDVVNFLQTFVTLADLKKNTYNINFYGRTVCNNLVTRSWLKNELYETIDFVFSKPL